MPPPPASLPARPTPVPEQRSLGTVMSPCQRRGAQQPAGGTAEPALLIGRLRLPAAPPSLAVGVSSPEPAPPPGLLAQLEALGSGEGGCCFGPFRPAARCSQKQGLPRRGPCAMGTPVLTRGTFSSSEIHPSRKPVIRPTPSLKSPSARRMLPTPSHASLSILGKRNCSHHNGLDGTCPGQGRPSPGQGLTALPRPGPTGMAESPAGSRPLPGRGGCLCLRGRAPTQPSGTFCPGPGEQLLLGALRALCRGL